MKKLPSTVYIIESPSLQDIQEDNHEGIALSHVLNLAKIDTKYFKVANQGELEAALENISTTVREIMTGKLDPRILFLHFSAHGNEDGIGLTDGTVLSWDALSDTLLHWAKDCDAIDPNGRYAVWMVSLSSCEGSYGLKMLEFDPAPCAALIGPDSAIHWSDALVAFTVFYHQSIFKGIRAPDAIKVMNLAAGIEFSRKTLPAICTILGQTITGDNNR